LLQNTIFIIITIKLKFIHQNNFKIILVIENYLVQIFFLSKSLIIVNY